MSTHPQLEAKRILDGGIVVRVCPATGNLPTRMSAASWQSLCQSTRRREDSAPGGDGYGSNAASTIRRRLNFCKVCRGTIVPPGLEIIPAAAMAAMKQQHREDGMAKTSGKCTACGRAASQLSSCRGEKLCASCSAVYSAANNRPTVLLEAMRKLNPEILARLDATAAVQVDVESQALKRIAAAIGYEGEDGEILIKAVEAMASTMPSCGSCATARAETMPDCESCTHEMIGKIADLQIEVDRLRSAGYSAYTHGFLDLALAMGMQEQSERTEPDILQAAIQTAALLEDTERQLNDTRLYNLRKSDALIEQQEVLDGIRQALGRDENFDVDDIVEAIAAMTHATERFRNLAEAAERRAGALQSEKDMAWERAGNLVAENTRLVQLLDEQNETVGKYIDPAREVLAEFAMSVLRGEAQLQFAGR